MGGSIMYRKKLIKGSKILVRFVSVNTCEQLFSSNFTVDDILDIANFNVLDEDTPNKPARVLIRNGFTVRSVKMTYGRAKTFFGSSPIIMNPDIVIWVQIAYKGYSMTAYEKQVKMESGNAKTVSGTD
jgi:hypothetical protein